MHAQQASGQPSYASAGQPTIVINNVNSNVNGGPAVSPKSKMVTLLLTIFLGTWGIHYFYVGKIGMGILYLLTGGIVGIGWIVDIIRVATGSFRDKYGLLIV